MNEPIKVQERCQFFLDRKSRTCRMLVKKGQKYCGEHAGQDRNRIRCPLDPKHTVDKDDLENHLIKCNSRLNLEPPYIQPNINGIDTKDSGTSNFSLIQVSDMELFTIIKKIENICSLLDIRMEDAFLEHDCMKGELESSSYGLNSKRHLRQQSSILAHADRLGLLECGTADRVCYVEFGAGRARLSYWLAKAMDKKFTDTTISTNVKEISYLLIEQSGQRYKFENKVTSSTPVDSTPSPLSHHFQRIRCAIEHVDLRLVDCIQKSDSGVAFCKHLCGSGTDAALRCLVNATRNHPSDIKPVSIIAALLAPCCHHRCDWRTFVGQKLLTNYGLTELEFKALVSMSSWATCGLVDNDDNKMGIDRKSFGRKCKLLLDYARAKYLEENSMFRVSLCYYVPEDVTPENVLIIVKKE